MSYVFGPVPSRRLGRSLGVDVVPFKTCTYDCVYCQLGATTCRTTQPKEWVPLSAVVADLRAALDTCPDYITLSGSGEPTLVSRTGELIERIKALTEIPVAVLTNGSLLWRPEVREQLLAADLVVPSLDAGDAETFQAVNRPHADISFEPMLDGLVRFRREYQGAYWLEVFLLAGQTDTDAAAARLAECVDRIQPDRVQLNTVTRPTTEETCVGVSPERMAELAETFRPRAEVIADFQAVHERAEFTAGRDEVLALLRRRPCSVDDVAGGLGIHRNEAVKYLEELAARDLLTQSVVGGKRHYRARP